MADLEELAGRVEDLAAKVRSLTVDETLSFQGRAAAIAAIVMLQLGTLDDAATAIRAQGN